MRNRKKGNTIFTTSHRLTILTCGFVLLSSIIIITFLISTVMSGGSALTQALLVPISGIIGIYAIIFRSEPKKRRIK